MQLYEKYKDPNANIVFDADSEFKFLIFFRLLAG